MLPSPPLPSWGALSRGRSCCRRHVLPGPCHGITCTQQVMFSQFITQVSLVRDAPGPLSVCHLISALPLKRHLDLLTTPRESAFRLKQRRETPCSCFLLPLNSPRGGLLDPLSTSTCLAHPTQPGKQHMELFSLVTVV